MLGSPQSKRHPPQPFGVALFGNLIWIHFGFLCRTALPPGPLPTLNPLSFINFKTTCDMKIEGSYVVKRPRILVLAKNPSLVCIHMSINFHPAQFNMFVQWKPRKKTSCFQVQGFRSVSRFKSYFGDKLTPKFFEENIKVIQTAYQIIGVTDAIPSKKNCPEFNNIFFVDLKCYIFCI